jgi:uncharacterized protein
MPLRGRDHKIKETNMSDENIEKESALTFPCNFPIKIIGKSGDAFESAAVTIVRKHAQDLPEGAFQLRPSKNNNFTAITVTINAKSQEQLNKIYEELTACEHVIMAL